MRWHYSLGPSIGRSLYAICRRWYAQVEFAHRGTSVLALLEHGEWMTDTSSHKRMRLRHGLAELGSCLTSGRRGGCDWANVKWELFYRNLHLLRWSKVCSAPVSNALAPKAWNFPHCRLPSFPVVAIAVAFDDHRKMDASGLRARPHLFSQSSPSSWSGPCNHKTF